MEHAKKMVLVPEERVEQLTHILNDRTIQTPGTTLSRLDEEMREILNSNKFPDEREKCKAYLQILQRYLYFVEEAKRNTTTKTTITPVDDVYRAIQSVYSKGEEMKETEKERMNDSFILDSVPLKFRQKAKLLINHLHSNALDRLTWDKYGVVSIDGVRVAESNIVDLVNDAMRSRKTVRPGGRHHFATLLRSVKVPREFIGNQELWSDGPSTSNTINTLQVPTNIISSHTTAVTGRRASDSSELLTDDTDNISEHYISPSNWESLSPLNKRKRYKFKE